MLSAADRFIPGLLDSSAGVDLDSPTVIWENTFIDEASYSGPLHGASVSHRGHRQLRHARQPRVHHRQHLRHALHDA